jgi:hypothetical protein
MIFYSRCNVSPTGATLHCFDMKYPAREKTAWDAIVTRMSRSLRPLNRWQPGSKERPRLSPGPRGSIALKLATSSSGAWSFSPLSLSSPSSPYQPSISGFGESGFYRLKQGSFGRDARYPQGIEGMSAEPFF